MSPSKAGTTSRPKSEEFRLSVFIDPASQTTVSSIKVTLPSTLKLSTKGLTQCTASDEEIVNTAGDACQRAKAGFGLATARIGRNDIEFRVQAFAGKNELLFYFEATSGYKYVLHGKITGRSMTIGIGRDVQQPVALVYAVLVRLDTVLSAKKRTHSLVSSTGCKSKKHTIHVTVRSEPAPVPPPTATSFGSASTRCSRASDLKSRRAKRMRAPR